MVLYPAIDIRGGRCVRLLQGDARRETQYGEPVQMARQWAELGARALHVVDLDGAFASGQNREAVRAIVRETGLPVQMGGGLRAMEDVRALLEDAGVSRVVLGTAAIENPELVRRAVAEFGAERVACGIDARDGRVAVRGWAEQSELSPTRLALAMASAGVRYVVYTDISRDGMLTGPNAESTAQLIRDTGLRVIGSGGVGTLEDLTALLRAGCAGAIAGKALYEGRFTLAQALAACDA